MYENAGVQIQKLRKKFWLTQEKFAEEIHTSQKYISEVENGHRKASLEFYVKIANYFRTSLDWICRFDLVAPNDQYTNMVIMKMKGFTEQEQAFVLRQIESFEMFLEQKKSASNPIEKSDPQMSI